jgi:acetylornithine deacetylase/succinyl-diaminopimelate desuccinylase-like protein
MTAVEDWLVAHEGEALETLKNFCRIPSVSADPAFGKDIRKAAEFSAGLLTQAGFPQVEIVETGGHPAVVAEWCATPGAPTVLVYGHYDVQPPDPLDKWRSDPFEPEVRDDRLYARGVSDDKGPLLIPLLVARAFNETTGGIPINLKVMIEGEEESGSPHLDPTVQRLAERLACDVVISADGAMWRADLASMTVASRGMTALEVTVEGAGKDLHSGRHGGTGPNPLRALVAMLASLHDAEGNVIVPGFADGAIPPDPAIADSIRTVDFEAGAYFDGIGAERPYPLPSGEVLLTRQWLNPTLEFNGISGGYQGAGTKTVIPGSASAKITCRLIAGQQPDKVAEAIVRHLKAALPTGFRLSVNRHGPGSSAFALDPDLPTLKLAEEILTEVLGAEPLRVAMGATIPIGEVFKNHLKADIVFFSFSTSDEDYHAPNEFFRLSSFRKGLIAWARLFERMGRIENGKYFR